MNAFILSFGSSGMKKGEHGLTGNLLRISECILSQYKYSAFLINKMSTLIVDMASWSKRKRWHQTNMADVLWVSRQQAFDSLHSTSMSRSLFSRLSLSFRCSLSRSSLSFRPVLSASFFSFSFALSSRRVSPSSSLREDTVWLWLACWFWGRRRKPPLWNLKYKNIVQHDHRCGFEPKDIYFRMTFIGEAEAIKILEYYFYNLCLTETINQNVCS